MLNGWAPYFEEERGEDFKIQRNGELVQNLPYLTEAFGDEAISFIEQHKKKPFFVYLSFNAPHGPLMAKKEDYDKLAHIKSERRRVYGAMNLSLDRQVGRLLDYLEAEGLTENTLLFFINDNGGPLNMGAINGNLRGQKGTCMEGGIRVPFMVQWPGKLPAGKVYNEPVISLDIFPTALAAAGGDKIDSIDGVNLLPFLCDADTGEPHERLFWRMVYTAAIREGDWKLVRLPDRPPMLFNLRDDPEERNNLFIENYQKAKSLQKHLFDWETELSNPLWLTTPGHIKVNISRHDIYEISDNAEQRWIYVK